MRIIYILPKSPVYDHYNNELKTPISFKSKSGEWIGVFEKEWGHQIGIQVLSTEKNVTFEFWRIDYRTDEILEYKYDNGLIHKIFPVGKINNRGGNDDISHCSSLLSAIKNLSDSKDIVLHIGSNGKVYNKIVKSFKNLAIVCTFHGEIASPVKNFFKLRKNPFRYFQLIKESFLNYYTYNNVHVITYQSSKNLHILKMYSNTKLIQFNMGINFDFFKPLNNSNSRQRLGLDEKATILLTVSRLNSLKQIDKLIRILNDLDTKGYNFLYIAIGVGETKYVNYLKDIGNELINKGKLLMPGFVSGGELLYYINASDLFISVSTSEGGPVSSMEAIACSKPILTTNTGYVAEVLKEYGKGQIVGVYDYKEWHFNICKFLNGQSIDKLDRNIAYSHFSNKVMVDKLINIYYFALKEAN